MLGKDHGKDQPPEFGDLDADHFDATRLDAELDSLVRQSSGFLQQVRVHRLGRRLADQGPIAIRHTRMGFSRDRPSIILDDDTTLKLKLFWPLARTLSCLVSIRWEDDIGWVVVGRSTSGEHVMMYAWTASIITAGHSGSPGRRTGN